MGTSDSTPSGFPTLKSGDHLCCIYETEKEHQVLLTPYLRQGLERNEKVVYIVDARTAETVLEYLRQDGLDPRPFVDQGQLVFLTAAESYLRDGIFDPDRMISMLGKETGQAVAEGYAALRVTGEMSWALKGSPGSDQLIEYESKLNSFFPDHPCLAICQYDRRRFPARLLLQVFTTHPFVAVGSEIFENHQYIPPEMMQIRDFEASTLSHWIDGLRIRKNAKKGETALRESQYLLNTLVEGTSDAVYVKDRRGRYLLLNASASRFIGKNPEDVIGKDDLFLFPAEEANVVMEGDRGVMNSGETATYEEYVTSREGKVSTFLSTKGPLRDESGNVVGIFGIARDITERRKLEEQLRQSQKMEAVGRLAGGIAHDFNNLLTVVAGYSDLLMTQVGEKSPLAESVEEIRRAGERAAALTQQLLAFSRRQVFQPKVLDMNEVVSRLQKMLHRLIGEDVELRTVLAAGLWSVKTDPGQIEQVIVNLVVNARDAMPAGGKLTIETANVFLKEEFLEGLPSAVAGPHVLLAVGDTGTGIAEEAKVHLFEPFFTTKEKGKGTGLGLSIVYGIVKQSGGQIAIDSETGKGTTVRIYLPRVEDRAERLIAVPGVNLYGREAILLVEDEVSVREITRRILVEKGYRVIAAGNGNDGLRLSGERKEPIDLLLTDMVMPGMSGRQLADRIVTARPGIKVLFMSGYTEDSFVRSADSKESFSFINKPFTLDGLLRRVREVLDGKGG